MRQEDRFALSGRVLLVEFQIQVFDGFGYSGCAVVDLKFGEYPAEIGFHRSLADIKAGGYLSVGETFGGFSQDSGLLLGQDRSVLRVQGFADRLGS